MMMNLTQRTSTPTSLALIAVLLVGGPIACGAQSQATELGAATPEALIERLQRAGESRDFREMVACMDPESRQEMARSMYAGSAMMIAFSGMAAAMAEAFASDDSEVELSPEALEGQQRAQRMTQTFNEIAARHGLPPLDEDEASEPDEAALEAALAKADLPAVAAELYALMMADMEETGAAEQMPLPTGALTALEVDGDTATAHFGDNAMELVRIDGRWFSKMDIGGGNAEGDSGEHWIVSEATPIPLGEDYEGRIIDLNDQWYVVRSPAAATLKAAVRGHSEEYMLSFRPHFEDDFFEAIPGVEIESGGAEGPPRYQSSVAVEADQALYLRVGTYTMSIPEEGVAYTLTVTVEN